MRYWDKNDYIEYYGEQNYRKGRMYIDLLAHGIKKKNEPLWVNRLWDKVCRLCRWNGEDIVNFSKSLINGQDPINLMKFLDYQLAEKEQDRYWGGSRDKFYNELKELNNENN